MENITITLFNISKASFADAAEGVPSAEATAKGLRQMIGLDALDKDRTPLVLHFAPDVPGLSVEFFSALIGPSVETRGSKQAVTDEIIVAGSAHAVARSREAIWGPFSAS